MISHFYFVNSLLNRSPRLALLLAALVPIVNLQSSPAAFASSSVNTPPSIQATYFVSKTGDNTDGKTWQTAFNELDQIKWGQIAASNADHVRLVIDGGLNGMSYITPLNVSLPAVAGFASGPASGSRFIDIERAAQAGHSGQVSIFGRNSDAAAVSINAPNVRFNGFAWRGIKIQGPFKCGIHVAAPSVALAGIEISGGPWLLDQPRNQPVPAYGLLVSGSIWPGAGNSSQPGAVSASQMIIHDTINAIYLAGSVNANISRCWLFRNTYLADDKQQSETAGITAIMPFSPLVENVGIADCVIGPGLGNGLVSGARANMTASDCLFINATHANFLKQAPQNEVIFGSGLGSGGLLNLAHVTSFVTKPNPQMGLLLKPHYCILSLSPSPGPVTTDVWTVGDVAVNDSVCYGGAVQLPANTRAGLRNTQFRTTGNTTALSDKEVDPLFKSNVSSFSDDVPISTLIKTDFSLSANSPAKGEGSRLTSVNQLLAVPRI